MAIKRFNALCQPSCPYCLSKNTVKYFNSTTRQCNDCKKQFNPLDYLVVISDNRRLETKHEH